MQWLDLQEDDVLLDIGCGGEQEHKRKKGKDGQEDGQEAEKQPSLPLSGFPLFTLTHSSYEC